MCRSFFTPKRILHNFELHCLYDIIINIMYEYINIINIDKIKQKYNMFIYVVILFNMMYDDINFVITGPSRLVTDLKSYF